MMPKSCAVYQCSAMLENKKNHSFHQFPKDPKLRRAWIARICREGYNPNASSYVCSFHFSEEDFNKGTSSIALQECMTKILRKGSIPSWNLRGVDGDQRVCSCTTKASRGARCQEKLSSSTQPSAQISFPSECVSMKVDSEPAASYYAAKSTGGAKRCTVNGQHTYSSIGRGSI